MADPQSYRPRTADIPTDPGVYRFLDGEGRVLYVGKAKNLRNRLQNYFQPPENLIPRIRKMVFTATRVVWVVVGSEVEALTLEYTWIKQFEPPFNVMFRDNKSYPYVAVSMADEYPRAYITRQKHRKGNVYFGPYTKVWAIRKTLDSLLPIFHMRSCTDADFRRGQRTGRPCFNTHLGLCNGACAGLVSKEENRKAAEAFIAFMDSDGQALIREKTQEMREAAASLEYEKAARLRDEIQALQAATERNVVVFNGNLNADVIGLEADEIDASVQIFYIRGGRIRGQRGWITETDGTDPAEVISQLLLHVYGDPEYDRYRGVGTQSNRRVEAPKAVDDRDHTPAGAIPSEIWVPVFPTDKSEIERWLAERRGGPVHLKRPQRGQKAQLAATVHANAKQAFDRNKLARAADITVRSQALEELREGLDLPRAPLRIEGYDISHTQGHQQVGSMVVFEDGLKKTADYRHFIVKGPDGQGVPDDTAAMDEVLRRRLRRLQEGAYGDDAGGEEDATPATLEATPADATGAAPARRFAYKPDLFVVDGGLPQVNAVQRVVDEFDADVAVIGLAKRLEEVWVPGEEYPVIFPRNSAALRLLQQVRDESHRFAITFHRKRRGQAMTRSVLDEIPGLGPAKQKALLKKLGSVKRIRAASTEELQQVPGVGPKLAREITDFFGTAETADATGSTAHGATKGAAGTEGTADADGTPAGTTTETSATATDGATISANSECASA
ncbi:excinuclease ABC subunit C [Actinobaculum suis]|uniref:UvrABC system protein C n=1 Tax=Actinobaculum suis TaxID=1657 RepID=A0A1G7C013_9ACTO|nr:excinuclease ABC subunit UvrC [Actinobaculum suis]MDY5153081.1 excinuclease ABC subunit UvrC [Actinobaculum suis]SDE31765.1 excinuclease ABC subunit C [Actinobaculum suis]